MPKNDLMKKLRDGQFVIVCGAFDVMSAKLAEMNGFDAIWASGFGISSARALPDAGIITCLLYTSPRQRDLSTYSLTYYA